MHASLSRAALIISALLAACSARELSNSAVNLVPDHISVAVDDPPTGIDDRGRDPSVVAVIADGSRVCAGALVAPDMIVVPRHCLATSADARCCPTGSASAALVTPAHVQIATGDESVHFDYGPHGSAIFVRDGTSVCEADVAFVVLDTPIKTIKPLAIRPHGIAQGDVVRTITFVENEAQTNTPTRTKVVRDQLLVLASEPNVFYARELPCPQGGGGIAVDPTSGDIVGLFSRHGPTCEGTDVYNVYSRADTFLELFEVALHWRGSGGIVIDDADAGVIMASRDGGTATSTSKKPETDTGGACQNASDCAAGICITDGDKKYCSRTCSSNQRCPSGYRCTKVGARSYCLLREG